MKVPYFVPALVRRSLRSLHVQGKIRFAHFTVEQLASWTRQKTRSKKEGYGGNMPRSPRSGSEHPRDELRVDSETFTGQKVGVEDPTNFHSFIPPHTVGVARADDNSPTGIGAQDNSPPASPPGTTSTSTLSSLPSSPSPPTLPSVPSSSRVVFTEDDLSTAMSDIDPIVTETLKDVSHLHDSDALNFVCTSTGWNYACECLQSLRSVKETFIKQGEKKRKELDAIDEEEKLCCMLLYSAYVSLVLDCPPILRQFNKDQFDLQMESAFGSLEKEGDGLFVLDETTTLNTAEHAHLIFSLYLSRKIWVPCPWTKYLSAGQGFFDRVCNNPITHPRNERATQVALQVLRAITHNRSSDTWKDIEFAPEGACLEAGRSRGGKRMAVLLGRQEDLKHVIMCPIYTGGKIRCITVDSASHVRYNFVNKYLGDCFRRLPCSVFGGNVGAWFKRVNFRLRNGESFISGDLEAATDNFDGRITDALIDEVAKICNLDEEDSECMKSFTTQCSYKVGKKFVAQNRGQMMGSVISFPLLCILSLSAYLLSRSNKWLENFLLAEPKQALKMLRRLNRVGINGDDVAFPGTIAETQRWEQGVAAIGGVVSRGKTLVSKTHFTINSELWTAGGQVNCLRPSLVTALSGKNRYYISPLREWKEFERASWINEKARQVFNLVERLNLDIPVSLGGLGIVKKFNFSRFSRFWRLHQARKSQPMIWLGSPRAREEDKRRLLEKRALWQSLDHEDRQAKTYFISRDMKKSLGTSSTQFAKWSMPVSQFMKIVQDADERDKKVLLGILAESAYGNVLADGSQPNLERALSWSLKSAVRETRFPGTWEEARREYELRMRGFTTKRLPRGLSRAAHAEAHASWYDCEDDDDPEDAYFPQ